jgi:acetyl-CoA acyltransferase
MSSNGRRVAVIEGVRTPFARAWTAYDRLSAADLGSVATRELLARSELDPGEVDSLVFGIVAAPDTGPNVAREIQFRTEIPKDKPAYSVQMYCASSARAVVDAAGEIARGDADVVIAGGVESMSSVRALFSPEATDAFQRAAKAKTTAQRLSAFKDIKPKHLKPQAPGLEEPTTGLSMGQSAELMGKAMGITREEQDQYALESHQKAATATDDGKLAEEIVAVSPPPKFDPTVATDTDIRRDTSLEKMAKLRAVFDRKNGRITAGNSSPLTDGGSAVLLMSEEKAKALGYEPKGYLKAAAMSALDMREEGLLMGPAYATPRALDRAGMSMSDLDLIEMHEAFAAQVLCNLQAFSSASWAKDKLGRDSAIGAIDPNKLNINGGSIAIGHPFGATGARLVMTLLNSMVREDKGTGLATMCAAGGLGLSLIFER